jgi:pimeloyl-ACP methyl ester carboxylesterase
MTRVGRTIVVLAGVVGSAAVYGPATDAQVASRPMKHISVNGGDLEYEVSGAGEPVILIHGTGVAATFAPTVTEPAMAKYRIIRFHRRGFAGSGRAPVPWAIKDNAADARGLLKALGIDKAHIVGHSYGGSVTLQFAVDYPEVVQSLVVIEPPVFDATGPSPFAKLDAQYASGDKSGAMDTFSTLSYGADWRSLAARVPGGPEQVLRDVDTVFQSESPAMAKWSFTVKEAAMITKPIVYMTGGGRHGRSYEQLRTWIPQLEHVIVPGPVTHGMLMENPRTVAESIAAFLARHPF